MSTICIAYIPVLHEGYRQFLVRQPIDRLLLLPRQFVLSMGEVDEFAYFKKDLRYVDAHLIKSALQNWEVAKSIEIADGATLRTLANQVKLSQSELRDNSNSARDAVTQIIMPNEDISRTIVENFFAESKQLIEYSPIFLRWDKHTATAETKPNANEISQTELTAKMFALAYQEAAKSTDWWRQVGGVIVKDGNPILTAFNQHLPNEQEPYLKGDVRSLFHKGDHFELNTAIHAESAMIAEAAKRGLSLQGASMYLTTFPCPVCAKLVAASGITSVFFTEGYAMLDGETILIQAGIRVERVLKDPSLAQAVEEVSTPMHYS